MEREELQQVPVVDVLKVFGRDISHGQDNLYPPPFRDKKSPSFHFSRDGHKLYDFVPDEGRKKEQCSAHPGLQKARMQRRESL